MRALSLRGGTMGPMDDTEATEPTNQSEDTADASSVEVPNITEGARSGLGHEPLTPKKPTTLLGRADTPEVASPDTLNSGGEQVAGGGGVAENAETGEVTQPGEPLPEVTGDGTGEALDPATGGADGGEVTGPEGTPIGDAAEADTDSSDADGPETPASDDTTQN